METQETTAAAMPTAGDAQGDAAERQDPPCTEAPAQVQPSAGDEAQMPDVPPTEEGSTACAGEGGGTAPPLAQEAVDAVPETAQHAAGTAERVPPEMVQEAAETAERTAIEQTQEQQPSSAGALPAAGQGGQAEVQVLPPDAVQTAEPCAPPPERAAEASPATEQDTGTADAESPSLSDEELLAHTAALWQYRPVPADAPDPAPEYMAEEMRIGTADMVAARVRGKKHKHDGTNCDDWFAAVHVGDIAILAVSDGAGSKRLSRVGARAASEAAVGAVYTQLRALLTADPALRAAYALPMEEAAFGEACAQLVGILHEGVRAARAAVEAAFYARCGRAAYTDLLGREPVLGDLAATLLLTLAVPVPEHGELLVLSCQVGDGMTAAVNTQAPYGSAVKLLGRPDSGDFVG
ncbi:protein phosphatase 2C domain-containing protein, partial [Selenomonas sp. oral taxon 126]|uniref:protein phosphatase 2C domain-containing protein n=1 Tax=Selenomonas sp. oral taxon 126 TaxID=712528 RepID=UPI0012ED253A